MHGFITLSDATSYDKFKYYTSTPEIHCKYHFHTSYHMYLFSLCFPVIHIFMRDVQKPNLGTRKYVVKPYCICSPFPLILDLLFPCSRTPLLPCSRKPLARGPRCLTLTSTVFVNIISIVGVRNDSLALRVTCRYQYFPRHQRQHNPTPPTLTGLFIQNNDSMPTGLHPEFDVFIILDRHWKGLQDAGAVIDKVKGLVLYKQ